MDPERSSADESAFPDTNVVLDKPVPIIPSASLEAVQAEVPLNTPHSEIIKPPSQHHWLRWTAFAAVSALLIGGGSLLAITRGHNSASQLSAGDFSTVRIPLGELAAQVDQDVVTPKKIQINGALQITNSLLLTPGTQPINPQIGELYYDKLTNRISYYDGLDFQKVGSGNTTVINVTNNTGNVISNVTNILSGVGDGVQLQAASPGTPQIGNFNISGTGTVGTLSTSIISSNGNAIYINPSIVDTTPLPPGTLIDVGTTTSVGIPDGPNRSDLFATKAFLGTTGGKLKTLSSYFTGGSSSSHIQFALYDDDGDVPSHPGALLASSQVASLVPNSWNTLTMPGITLNPNTTYWMAVITDDAAATRPSATSSGASCFVFITFGGMPSNFPGCYKVDVNYSVYMTYVTSAAASGNVSVAQATINQDGSVLLHNSEDSSTAFEIQNATGGAVFNVDTVNDRIAIGKTNAQYKLDIAAGDINLSTGHSIRFGGLPVLTNTNAGVVAISSMTSGGSVRVQADGFSVQDMNAGHKNLNIDSNGAAVFSNKTNSTAGFQVQNATAQNVFTIDTTNNQIILGNDGTASTVSVAGIRGGNVSGNNQSGKNLVISAGNGTGTGGSGDIIFNTASGVSNPLVTLDSTTGAEGNTTTGVSWSHTIGNHPDEILIVAANAQAGSNPATVTSVTYNGVPLTMLATLSAAESAGGVWYMVNPPAGAHTVTVTYSGTFGGVGAEATSFYNVDQANPIGGFNTQTVNFGTSVSTTLTGTNAGQLVFDALLSRQDLGFPIPGTNQIQPYEQLANNVNTGSYKNGNGGSTTMTWAGTGVGSSLNQIVLALNPEPNVTPDPLSEALRLTQSGTVGIALSASENALASISLGGTADRNIVLNQNPTTGAGHSLTVQAGGGAIGNNNGGNLVLQGGFATGTGTAGSVIVRPAANSSLAFLVQNADASSNVFSVDTTNKLVTVTKLAVTGDITLSGHLATTGTTPAIAAGAAACTTPTVSVVGTDTAGTITVTTGTGCSGSGTLATLTFSTAFAAAPHMTLTPASATALGLGVYVSPTTTVAALTTGSTATSTTTYKWNYITIQ
jgi:hypothetical protein